MTKKEIKNTYEDKKLDDLMDKARSAIQQGDIRMLQQIIKYSYKIHYSEEVPIMEECDHDYDGYPQGEKETGYYQEIYSEEEYYYLDESDLSVLLYYAAHHNSGDAAMEIVKTREFTLDPSDYSKHKANIEKKLNPLGQASNNSSNIASVIQGFLEPEQNVVKGIKAQRVLDLKLVQDNICNSILEYLKTDSYFFEVLHSKGIVRANKLIPKVRQAQSPKELMMTLKEHFNEKQRSITGLYSTSASALNTHSLDTKILDGLNSNPDIMELLTASRAPMTNKNLRTYCLGIGEKKTSSSPSTKSKK